MIPVEGRPGLFRDSSSGAIINKDTSTASVSRRVRERAKQREQEIEDLKEEVSEIKQLLHSILERL